MKRRNLAVLCAAVLASSIIAACGTNDIPAASAPAETKVESTEGAEKAESAVESEGAEEKGDQEAADHVAELIDAIYVQEWNENTDKQCADAKAAWDALTDEQKELVSGEDADPDYFGRDTGDASKDDPLNGDEIGENELLVVSFGTSFNDSRAEDIGGIEKALAKAYPDWSVRRAFTAQIIINHVQARDEEKIDNVDQALQRAVDNGVKNLVVQPTHLMHGAEYDEITAAVKSYEDKFESVAIAEPLLGQVGEDSSSVNEDKKAVAEAITKEALTAAGYKDLKASQDDGTAFVFMGHGTSHAASVTYEQMQSQMEALDHANVFIGTVEGKPESTSCENVIEKIKAAGYKKVVLRPLMVVAGDHANNDMAGDDEDSWKSLFLASGAFDSVDTQIAGLGGIPAVQELYVSHSKAAIESLQAATGKSEKKEAAKSQEDGTYDALFTTDSSMFHVNEAHDGKGVLTVKDGEMNIHVSLVSKNITNLYLGTADKAEKDSANVLQPTTDKVTYSDGSEEEVFGFDIPVEKLDEEFDLAILGKKGKWYDHKVKVVIA
ncbi:cobalt chelatase [Oribacterium sp. C9]|uniref:sirohydrochlorin cobaltochelatase n=1 Tax=Oribacterium sp. C9 TaxID=1943579 RepID=UPI00098F300D|nr:sirohydrochlorin cobaltochelatase [Oribacterium sp. C9]OON84897.1 cobalt chelatase [Oribacterium sp. C9]